MIKGNWSQKEVRWVKSDHSIFGLPCVQLNIGCELGAEPEYKLELRYGEVYPTERPGQYAALVRESALANRLAARLGLDKTWGRGDEARIRVDSSELGAVVEILVAYPSMDAQIVSSNRN